VISSDHLAPGVMGQIKASVDTAGRSGQLVKRISIYSNDRTNPVMSVAVIMNIVPK
jgi:hypothetical protein